MRTNLLTLWMLFVLAVSCNRPWISSVQAQINNDPSWTGNSRSFRDVDQARSLPTSQQPTSQQPTTQPHTLPVLSGPSLVAPAYSPTSIAKTRSVGQQVVQAQFTSNEPALPGLSRSTSTPHNASSDESAGEGKSIGSRPLKPPSQEQDKGKDKEKRSSGTAEMFVSVMSSLLIVIGLVLGAAWCYRRAMPGTTGSLPKQVIQVLGRTPLAPRQQLVLIRFGQKLVLVSNLHGEVRTVSEITDPLEVDRVAGMCESAQAGSISDSFRTVLHNIGRNG